MRSLTILLTGLVLLTWAVEPCPAVTLFAGSNDGFAAPQDPVSPSADLTAVLAPLGGTQDFDLAMGINGGVANAQVAHTFTQLPPNIIAATLEVSIRAGGSETQTDGIFLSFVDWPGANYGSAIRWGRSFGPVLASPPYYPFDDPGVVGAWNSGDSAILTFNLNGLPMAQGGNTTLIQDLNWRGFLDVNVSDETAVDYMKLKLVAQSPPVGPGGKFPKITAGEPTLLANTPNPFRHSTTVNYVLTDPGDVTLRVFDVTGRELQAVRQSGVSTGAHSWVWDGRDALGHRVPGGVYFYRLEAAGRIETRKMTVLR